MPLINNIKTIILDLITIRSKRVFAQPRSFYFRVFKKEYSTYKFWIEPRCPSNLPLDVIIPAIEKDAATLPHAIIGIKKHLKHPIGNVYIVAPQSALIESIAKSNGCVFVNELDVCSTPKGDINYIVNGVDRSGWIYQQMLKFNFFKVGRHENYLVVDADTVFIQDTCFEAGGKLLFDFSDEFHLPYYVSYEKIVGYKHHMQVSFITHYMLFSKNMVQKLIAHIEQRNNNTISAAIIALQQQSNDQSYFSEYETYANYCIATEQDKYRIRYWFNKSLHSEGVNDLIINIDKAYKSLSFHNYNT